MTIEEKLQKISNDYSREEKIFEQKTGKYLLSNKNFKKNVSNLSVSIIIPAYNSHNTIIPVFKAISNQTFFKRGGKLEIILCDDGSKPPLFNKIFEFNRLLDIKYVYSPKNRGAGTSRDDAIKISQNEYLVFIDSDIVVPPNFIDNHLLIHSVLQEENIIVSFRENVNPKDRRINNQKKWLQGNAFYNDHRTNLYFKPEWAIKSSDQKLVGKKFKILEETTFFKDFGLGNKYFAWTLPMMVLTCAMSAPSSLVKKAIPCPKELSGWGFNDTCLAAKMIANGAKVIPNMNSTALHILEKKHTKKTNFKNIEYAKNEKIYKKMLKQKYL